jgi:hypothetical protein
MRSALPRASKRVGMIVGRRLRARSTWPIVRGGSSRCPLPRRAPQPRPRRRSPRGGDRRRMRGPSSFCSSAAASLPSCYADRSVTQAPHTARPRCSRKPSPPPQKTQDDSGRESMITSSCTEISSGSFWPRPKRFRISIGITMRPSSSTWRTMPVVFKWACEDAARNAARAPIVIGRPSRLALCGDSPRRRNRKPRAGMSRGPPYDCRR